MSRKAERYEGRVCKHHPDKGGERLVSNNSCPYCMVDWHAANRDKVKDRVAKNWLNHKANIVSWALENPDKVKEIKRNNRKKNAEKIKASKRKWDIENPHKNAANNALRKATKLQATPSWANRFFMEEAYDLARLRTKMFNFKWNVDHIVPLNSKKVCGLHCEANMQVIPEFENFSKSNRIWPDMPVNEGMY